MSQHGIVRTAREVFLTLGAVLGVVCIVVTAAGFAFGVKPLIFRSGSMSPAIHTGDMAISRTVDASALKRGDIVSVINSGGERVTHRLVNAARQGDARQLTLKGDANKRPDTEVYTVSKAERVIFTIPKAGYVVNSATSPAGVFVLGLYVAVLLVTVFRRGTPTDPKEPKDPPKRSGGSRRADRPSRRRRFSRAASRSVAAAVVGSTLMIATPAIATPWTDDVPVTGSVFAAHTVAAPTTMTCANTDHVLLGNRGMNFTAPQLNALDEYVLRLYTASGTQVGGDHAMTLAGTTYSYKVTQSEISSLLSLGGTYYARVYSKTTAANWEASTYKSYSFTMTGLLALLVYFDCGSLQP
jgi:signal peptidase I